MVNRFMYSKDEKLRGLFENVWFRTTKKWLKREPTLSEIIDFLNSETRGDFSSAKSGTGSEGHGMLTRIRRSMRHLQKFFKLFEFSFDDDELVLTIKCENDVDAQTVRMDEKGLYRKLRQMLQSNHIEKLGGYVCRGKAINAVKDQPVSNKFNVRGTGITFSGYRFVHRARLDLLMLNAHASKWAKGENRDATCRRCGAERETLPHVLNHCPPNTMGILKRHDAIQNRIVEALPHKKKLEVRVNKRTTLPGNARRPDIVIIDHKSREIRIAEITSPFDNGEAAIGAATGRKVNKYDAEAEEFRKQGFKVQTGTITVGALGTWCPQNNTTLKMLGFSETGIKRMTPYLIGEAIEMSKNIFWTHILKEKYTAPNNMYNPDSYYAKGAVSP